MLSKQIEDVLTKDGGWMSAGAILNRCDDGCTSAKVRNALDELLAMNVVQQIHGISGLEYALAGVKLPAGHKPPPPVTQGKASDVQFDPTEQKASGLRVMSAPSLAVAPRAAPPAAAKPVTARDRVLNELRMAGDKGADMAQLMNRTACSFGNVNNALSDLREDSLVRTDKSVMPARHYIRAAAPVETLDVMPRAPEKAEQTAQVETTAPLPSAHRPIPKGPRGYTRDQIRDLLDAEPALKPKEIAERLQLCTATVSYHLKNLSKEATAVIHAEVEPAAVADVVDTPALNEEIKNLFELVDATQAEIAVPNPSNKTSRFALWSTGELVIKRMDGMTVTLDATDTRALLRYLDGVAQIGTSA